MKKRNLVFALALIGVTTMPLAVSGRQYTRSLSELESARTSLNALVQDASEVLALRARQPIISASEKPAQDLIAQLNAILAHVGIPANRLKSLNPESDTALHAGNSAEDLSKYRRQSLRLTLERLSVAELGAFLLQWKTSQQVWNCSRIELTHARSQGADNTNTYDASLLLTALYLSPSSGKPQ